MKTRSGRPCGAKPKPGTDLCPWHSPDYIARAKEFSRKGGIGRSNRARLAKMLPSADLTADEILSLLGGAFLEIIARERDASDGPALATMARTMLEVRRVTDLETHLTEMSQRIGALAAKIGA